MIKSKHHLNYNKNYANLHNINLEIFQKWRITQNFVFVQAYLIIKLYFVMAESIGFEPTNAFALTIFKTAALNRSANSQYTYNKMF